MPKGTLLTFKQKTPKDHPLIEIAGPIDIGKNIIASLVAKRLSSPFLSLPVLDPTTLTGRGLLHTLTTTPKDLEAHPEWWAHIYSAHLYEQKNTINSLLTQSPVIVTNYTYSLKTWMGAMDVDISNFCSKLTKPNIIFVLNGEPIYQSSRLVFDFSVDFVRRIKKAYSYSNDIRVIKVNLSDFYSLHTHTYVNNICVAISAHMAKHGYEVNEKELYHPSFFMKKKDV